MKTILEIQTTFPDQTSASQVIVDLLDQKLIACANQSEVLSQYTWEHQMEKQFETMVFIKTTLVNKNQVINQIIKNHPYTLPSVLCTIVETSDAYAAWVEQSCQ